MAQTHRGNGDDGRAERARTESMTVLPVGGGSYDVVTADQTVYTVDLVDGTCTCPDHRIRGVRCKHLRRAALEVTADRVPPPGRRHATCADCRERVEVPERDRDPVYCAACTLRTGTTVVDRETGDLVVVKRTTDRRARDTPIAGTEHTVATYPGNEAYDPDDVVVEVLYPLPADLEPEAVESRQLRTYRFPRGRLERR